eukprot:Mrub_07095.p1 GENE.Mrub_07095~~Mrub_07095.p1  ORF type:complete len:193 (-),score=18.01 Mrub_07095:237-815(-)
MLRSSTNTSAFLFCSGPITPMRLRFNLGSSVSRMVLTPLRALKVMLMLVYNLVLKVGEERIASLFRDLPVPVLPHFKKCYCDESSLWEIDRYMIESTVGTIISSKLSLLLNSNESLTTAYFIRQFFSMSIVYLYYESSGMGIVNPFLLFTSVIVSLIILSYLIRQAESTLPPIDYSSAYMYIISHDAVISLI